MESNLHQKQSYSFYFARSLRHLLLVILGGTLAIYNLWTFKSDTLNVLGISCMLFFGITALNNLIAAYKARKNS